MLFSSNVLAYPSFCNTKRIFFVFSIREVEEQAKTSDNPQKEKRDSAMVKASAREYPDLSARCFVFHSNKKREEYCSTWRKFLQPFKAKRVKLSGKKTLLVAKSLTAWIGCKKENVDKLYKQRQSEYIMYLNK